MALNTIEEIIQDIRLGKMVILMDDEDRENEGDIVMAAECVSAEHIAFMARYACGLICMPMSRERCAKLNLPLMVARNASGFGTKFTVSIEAAHGVTTGISAADRALTVRAAVARNAKAEDIVQPGHIFPLMAEPGGVLVRAGHTEAACDLSRLAGFEAAGVICEIMNPDGTMARRPELEKFAQEHNIKIGTIADLIHYRVVNEGSIEKISEGPIHTDHGDFVLHAYRDHLHDEIHFAIVKGDVKNNPAPLVRVQFGSALRDLIGTQTARPHHLERAARAAAHRAGRRRVGTAGQSRIDRQSARQRRYCARQTRYASAGRDRWTQHAADDRPRLADSARSRGTQISRDGHTGEVQCDFRLRSRNHRLC